jgi:hypothetical protein
VPASANQSHHSSASHSSSSTPPSSAAVHPTITIDSPLSFSTSGTHVKSEPRDTSTPPHSHSHPSAPSSRRASAPSSAHLIVKSEPASPPLQVTGTGCGPIVDGVRQKRGQGVSCHSCKTNKDPKLLFHCQNKGEAGIKKRRCRKKVSMLHNPFRVCLARYSLYLTGACFRDNSSSTVKFV